MPEVSIAAHFIKIARVDEERLDDALVLLHPVTLELKLLNETATVLWDALGELPTAEKLASLLSEARSDLSSADSIAYVAAFLDDLQAAGFVERQERAPR